MKDQNRYVRPSTEQWDIMKNLKRETKRAGLYKLEARARLVTK